MENTRFDDACVVVMDGLYEDLGKAQTTKERKSIFNRMKMLYDVNPVLQKLWSYIETAKRYIAKFVRKIIAMATGKVVDKRAEYFYIMRFYDDKGVWLWDKVGSTDNVSDRMSEHLHYYKEAYSVETLLSVFTGEVPASSLEDYVRDYLIRTLGRENFKAKDRFLTYIDVEDVKAKIPACLASLRAAVIV